MITVLIRIAGARTRSSGERLIIIVIFTFLLGLPLKSFATETLQARQSILLLVKDYDLSLAGSSDNLDGRRGHGRLAGLGRHLERRSYPGTGPLVMTLHRDLMLRWRY